jgi:FMN reductase (NADPH)
MEINPTIQTLLNHRSVRKYKPEQPSEEIVETIVRAGQQAPFAAQLYSVLLSRKGKIPFDAPLHFILCVDIYKLERFMQQRGWKLRTNHLMLLMFGIQDAAYVAQNMVVAAESLGLGTCFLGNASTMANKIAKQFKLPSRVFPLVGLVMGYPDEDFPPRPRYPLSFTLFEDTYPELTDAQVREAMQVMDEGYLQQDYYRKLCAKIGLEVEREETFSYQNYSWTEHVSRKWGQWWPSPQDLLEQLRLRGFDITADQEKA